MNIKEKAKFAVDHLVATGLDTTASNHKRIQDMFERIMEEQKQDFRDMFERIMEEQEQDFKTRIACVKAIENCQGDV